MRKFLAILFITSTCGVHAAIKYDSIGTETKDDKIFIIHRVEEKETLYTVSRRYDVPIYAIIKHNPPTEFGLELGQIIKIPLIEKEKKVQKIPTDPVIKPQDIKREEGNESVNNFEAVKEITPKLAPVKDFVHIVQPGETMYSISRLYDVSVASIKKWNELESIDLSIGQKLVIKRKTKIENEIKNNRSTSNAEIHVVEASETLYSISRTYGVALEDLKKWNELEGNEISIGQELFVSEPVPVNTETASKVIIEQTATKEVKDTVIQTIVIDTARYNIKPESKTNFEEVIESGLAEKIAGTSGNRKYLALHRTAKTGTIMKVKNEMNDQEVFVRVIGPLPDTSNNKNVVIKISKAAYDSLGAIDPKFRVTVTYIP